jgi:hypothetical protein
LVELLGWGISPTQGSAIETGKCFILLSVYFCRV